ncbi:spindle and kinetochore-associated protein 2 isoform X1 [Rana temporaria]|uniref:spindle and kinetochore-associated protein 2 isoform X1 n=1 Tax=Rana temporaria TaxID=8407 RepID=UPI001AAD5E81|nr:spindle and kinetochore-associated protein 2 isoform X1 [Rana temporaria]
METAVNKLEALFQKAESDLDYIEQKLEFEIRKSLPDESAAQENPTKLLEQLSGVKSRFKNLSAQLDRIATDQQKSVESIQQTMTNTLKIVKHLQQQTDSQVPSLSEEELQALQQFEALALKGIDLQSTSTTRNATDP